MILWGLSEGNNPLKNGIVFAVEHISVYQGYVMTMLHNAMGFEYYNLQIRTPRLILRCLYETDCVAWLKVKQKNYDFLQPFEPIWDMDALSYIGFNRLVVDMKSAFEKCNYYGFVIVHPETEELIGHIEVGNILGWPKQSATIGYWIDQDIQGQGYMSEVVQAVCRWAFQRLRLVKIEAGTMTHNLKSQKVLAKSGFKQEGLSKAYGEIDGTYTDHVLWGVTLNDMNHHVL